MEKARQFQSMLLAINVGHTASIVMGSCTPLIEKKTSACLGGVSTGANAVGGSQHLRTIRRHGLE